MSLEAEMLCLCVLCKNVNGNVYKHSVLLEKKFITKHVICEKTVE